VRLFVDRDLGAGARFDLDRPQTHYLVNVMRLEAGAGLLVFNGRDGEWRAKIEVARKNVCTLVAEARTRPQAASPDVWLVFAPVKRAPIDYIAAKATELGVRGLRPIVTRHTAVTRVNLERVRANALEAAEQCGRLDVPEIVPPQPLEQLIASWPAGRRLLLCAETGDAPDIGSALAAEAHVNGPGDSGPWAILVGPEGGFARAELDALRKLTFVKAVSLGPRVLRAETAAVAALACWQSQLGDWSGRGAGAADTAKAQD
jgi:16S rRNA (uracil1498-N3)-methyltransferase